MMQPAPDQTGRSGLDRPRFRQDLVAEPIEEHGGRFIDVMDPDSGNLFRFYEVEYSLACGMDGERDVAGIVKWAQDELGLTPSAQEVRTVIATLGDLGFIATGVEAAADGPELATGVVAAAAVAPAMSSDVELGQAGPAVERKEPSAGSRREPSAPAVALGAPGAAPIRSRTTEPSAAVALGSPGRAPARATPAPPVSAAVSSDVSLDLTDHIAVRRDDVKEAVRASKVMSAVDVPQDLLDALEDRPSAKPEAPPAELKKPEARVEAKPARIEAKPEARVEAKPEVKPEPRVEAKPAARVEVKPEPRVEAKAEVKPEPRVEAKPEAKPEPRVEAKPEAKPAVAKPAVELPKVPVVTDKPTQPTAPRSGVSPALIVVLILAVLGAAGFAVWKYVLQKPAVEQSTSTEPAVAPVKPEPPAPPPPPPAPTAKVVLEQPAVDEIRVARAGVVETILADKAAVKDGDVMVKLVGDKPIEAEITGLTRELKGLQDKLDATTKKLATAKGAGNKAAAAQAEADLAERQKALETKKTQLTAKTAELEKYLIHAKGNGEFTPVAKQGQKLAANAVVAKLQREATPVATFKVTDAAAFPANASVELALGSGEQRIGCSVAEVQGDSVKVMCPADPALSEGADVTLKLPAAAPAMPSGTPGAGETPTGAGETPAGAGETPAGAPGSAAAEAPAGSAAPEGSAAAPGSN